MPTGIGVHEMDEILRKLQGPLALAKQAEEVQRIARVTDVMKQHHRLMESTGLSRYLGATGVIHKDLELLHSLYQKNFSLPAIEEARRLIDKLDYGSVVSKLRERERQFSAVRRAVEHMRSPWLDQVDQMRSTRGLIELIGIGHALDEIPPFDESLGNSLRDDLGDWRDTINWPQPIFTDLSARLDFYVDRGFDDALTNFPSDTFDEGLEASRLTDEPPLLVDVYGSPIPRSSDPEEERAVRRTNAAHDWLFRLESQIRHLIQIVMTTQYGPDWPKHKLPNGMLDEWRKKRDADNERGVALSLIAYADFSDYTRIICKRDLWNDVFSSIFVRQEDVRESLQRLHPIRICTMHARPISHEDELLLYVEVKRIHTAIRSHLA